ncbi:related to members of the aldo/keto reductase family [Cephalotrichum gorgonifer]|uniref:Related to members of the aldo/keto reductase family n=1 Tax=Cephalotrichum gorgonifer TaxID=2041049 RepID=A0AAE8SZC1_9PEZI|nr:related to members of the aldo/keto reductase family [Cephalotrichum gorgonifer]
MSLGTSATLSSGHKIPTLGYGTWQSSPGEVSVGVYEALKAGYRHLDLAKIYQNQPEVAEGMKKAFAEIPGLKREDIFITSKLWNNSHRPEHVEAALEQTLKELELDYLDLYLIHWPVAFEKTSDDTLSPVGADGTTLIDNGVSIIDTWRAMTKLPSSKVRSIGVSNFTPAHIDAIAAATGVWPAVNQVERHPLLQQNDTLIKYAKENNIHITAYSAFGNNNVGAPLLLEHKLIKDIAEKASATPAQVLLAWAQVGGHSVIPKSVTPSRIISNFQEIELSASDIEAINQIGEARRYNIPTTFKPKWNINLWDEPLEKDAANQVVV